MVLPAAPRMQSVFFDLGFTLINFEGEYHKVLKDSYAALALSLSISGCQFDAATFASRFGEVMSAYYRTRDVELIEQPVEDYLRQVLQEFDCGDLPDHIIVDALEAMYRVTEACWQVEEDAHATLQSLQGQGYQLGLITNASNAADANRLIDTHNLRHYFKVILISAEEKIRKPDTRIYTRAMQRMGTVPGNCVMVGDTLGADVLGAQNSGMKAVWIKRRAKRAGSELESINPDAVVSSLSELTNLIPRLI